MSSHIDGLDPPDRGDGSAFPRGSRRAMTGTRRELAGTRTLTVVPIQGDAAGLRAKLRAVANEIDGLWHEALASQNLDLVTRSVDASHGVHRALLALGDDRSDIGAPLKRA